MSKYLHRLLFKMEHYVRSGDDILDAVYNDDTTGYMVYELEKIEAIWYQDFLDMLSYTMVFTEMVIMPIFTQVGIGFGGYEIYLFNYEPLKF